MKKTIYLILFCSFILSISSSIVIADSYKEDSVTNCVNNICTTIIYGNPIYYRENGGFFGVDNWLNISEDYNTTGCMQNYDYCVDENLYQNHLKENYGDYEIAVSTVVNNDTTVQFGYKLAFVKLGGNVIFDFESGNVSINGSTGTFELTRELEYKVRYISSMVTDALIITDPSLLQNSITDKLELYWKLDRNFTYNITTDKDGYFENVNVFYEDKQIHKIGGVSVFDKNDNPIDVYPLGIYHDGLDYYLFSDLNATRLREVLPEDYPLVIDPPVNPILIETASYNGYIAKKYFTGRYVEVKNPAGKLNVGQIAHCIPPPINTATVRATVEYNLSQIPKNSKLLELLLYLTPSSAGDYYNPNVTFYEITYDSNYYGNSQADKQAYFLDMGGGEYYGDLNISAGMLNYPQKINLTETAENKVESLFNNHTRAFAIGMRSRTEATNCPPLTNDIAAAKFYSNGAARVQYRPFISLTYQIPSSWDFSVIFALCFVIVSLYTSLNIFFCKSKEYVKKCNTK